MMDVKVFAMQLPHVSALYLDERQGRIHTRQGTGGTEGTGRVLTRQGETVLDVGPCSSVRLAVGAGAMDRTDTHRRSGLAWAAQVVKNNSQPASRCNFSSYIRHICLYLSVLQLGHRHTELHPSRLLNHELIFFVVCAMNYMNFWRSVKVLVNITALGGTTAIFYLFLQF